MPCKQILFTLVFCIINLLPLLAQENKNIFKGEQFELQIFGEVYTYNLTEKERTVLIAVDGVELRIDEMLITANRAAWYPQSQDIYLEGDIEVKGENFIFRSNQMTYNLKERKGILQKPTAIINAPDSLGKTDTKEFVEIERGKYLFVEAEKVEITRQTFYITQLKITTNGFAKPFYHIKAKEAKYKQKESIQSWGNTLKIGKFPVFYFPYLAKDLQYNWPWFHLTFNHNSRYGVNATLAVKTSFNDQSVLVAVRPMELRGVLGNIQYTRITKTMDLKINAEGIKEDWRGQSKIDLLNPSDGFINPKKNNNVQSREDRYRIHSTYKQELMWNFSFDAEIDKIDTTSQFIWKSNNEYKISQSAVNSPFADHSGDLKKGSYRRDYYRSDFYEDKSPESLGQLKWVKGPYMARLIYKFDVNEFSFGEERNYNEELEIKPGVLFNINGLQLLDNVIPIYLDHYTRLESLIKKITNPNNAISSYDSERMSIRTAISSKYTLGGFLNTEAYIGFDETGYSNLHFKPKLSFNKNYLENQTPFLDLNSTTNMEHNINRFAGIYGGSMSLEAKNFYNIHIDFLNINGVMHRVVPKIEYIGNTIPNRLPNELPQFDAIDTLDKDDYILFNLKNFFDVQKANGWENLFKIDLWAKWNLERENEEKWEHITTELQIKPSENLLLRTNFRFHPGDGLVRSISALTYQWNKTIDVTVAERWEENFPWQTDLNFTLHIGERYTIESGVTYLNKTSPIGNRQVDQFVEYYVAIQRKFHELLFTLEYRRDRLFDEQSIGLSIRLF